MALGVRGDLVGHYDGSYLVATIYTKLGLTPSKLWKQPARAPAST
jgi:hypothetical protein